MSKVISEEKEGFTRHCRGRIGRVSKGICMWGWYGGRIRQRNWDNSKLGKLETAEGQRREGKKREFGGKDEKFSFGPNDFDMIVAHLGGDRGGKA